MKKVRRMASVVAVMIAVSLAACSSDSSSPPAGADSGGGGSGSGTCPNVAGTWLITKHCQPTSVGTTVQLTQSGCTLQSSWGGGTIFNGSIDANGTATLSGNTGSTTMTCTGPVGSGVWTVSCNPACDVELHKQ